MGVFNCIFTFQLGLVLIALSLISLNDALSNISKIEGLLLLTQQKLDFNVESILKYSREIMYGIQLAGLYAGFLCLFKARLTKFFAFIYFAVQFGFSYYSYITSKAIGIDNNKEVLFEALVKLSIFGGILSI